SGAATQAGAFAAALARVVRAARPRTRARPFGELIRSGRIRSALRRLARCRGFSWRSHWAPRRAAESQGAPMAAQRVRALRWSAAAAMSGSARLGAGASPIPVPPIRSAWQVRARRLAPVEMAEAAACPVAGVAAEWPAVAAWAEWLETAAAA